MQPRGEPYARAAARRATRAHGLRGSLGQPNRRASRPYGDPMRYPTLALASTVLLGVGLLPARIAAQNIEDAAPSALSGRVHIDLGANAPSKANAPAAALLLRGGWGVCL